MSDKGIINRISKYYSHYINRDRCFWLFTVSFITILLFLLIPPILGSAFRNLKEGEELKPFTIKDIDGNDFSIESHKGKHIVLNFFQIDKDKSKDALKALATMYPDFKGKDVVFVAISSDIEQIENIKKFRDENKIEFPILMDSEKTVYQSYGIFVMPVTALVDADFKLAYEYSSFMMGFEEEVGGRIKVALGEMTQEEYEESSKATVIEERSEDEKSAIKKLGQAEVLLARGKADDSLKLLREVVELDPNIAKAHLLLGDALLKKGQFDEATAEYNKVKEMVKATDPLAKATDVGIGAIHALKGELDQAKKVLSVAAMINPNPVTSAKAYYWLGFVEEKNGDLKKAVTNYKKAVEKLLSKADRGH